MAYVMIYVIYYVIMAIYGTERKETKIATTKALFFAKKDIGIG